MSGDVRSLEPWFIRGTLGVVGRGVVLREHSVGHS